MQVHLRGCMWVLQVCVFRTHHANTWQPINGPLFIAPRMSHGASALASSCSLPGTAKGSRDGWKSCWEARTPQKKRPNGSFTLHQELLVGWVRVGMVGSNNRFGSGWDQTGRCYVRKRRARGLNSEGSWPTLTLQTGNGGGLKARR